MMRKKAELEPSGPAGLLPVLLRHFACGRYHCVQYAHLLRRPAHYPRASSLGFDSAPGPMDSLCSIGCFHIRFGICVLGDWHLGHCPGEPGSVLRSVGWRANCKAPVPCLLLPPAHHHGAARGPWRRPVLLAGPVHLSGGHPRQSAPPPFIAWRTGCAFVGPSAAGRWDGDIKLAC